MNPARDCQAKTLCRCSSQQTVGGDCAGQKHDKHASSCGRAAGRRLRVPLVHCHAIVVARGRFSISCSRAEESRGPSSPLGPGVPMRGAACRSSARRADAENTHRNGAATDNATTAGDPCTAQHRARSPPRTLESSPPDRLSLTSTSRYSFCNPTIPLPILNSQVAARLSLVRDRHPTLYCTPNLPPTQLSLDSPRGPPSPTTNSTHTLSHTHTHSVRDPT